MSEFGAIATLETTVDETSLRAAQAEIESEIEDIPVTVDVDMGGGLGASGGGALGVADGGQSSVDVLAEQTELLEDIEEHLASGVGGGGGGGSSLPAIGLGGVLARLAGTAGLGGAAALGGGVAGGAGLAAFNSTQGGVAEQMLGALDPTGIGRDIGTSAASEFVDTDFESAATDFGGSVAEQMLLSLDPTGVGQDLGGAAVSEFDNISFESFTGAVSDLSETDFQSFTGAVSDLSDVDFEGEATDFGGSVAEQMLLSLDPTGVGRDLGGAAVSEFDDVDFETFTGAVGDLTGWEPSTFDSAVSDLLNWEPPTFGEVVDETTNVDMPGEVPGAEETDLQFGFDPEDFGFNPPRPREGIDAERRRLEEAGRGSQNRARERRTGPTLDIRFQDTFDVSPENLRELQNEIDRRVEQRIEEFRRQLEGGP